MAYKKLSADCDEKLFALVKKASKIEDRKVSNFIRGACREKANRILKEAKDGAKNN